MSPGESAKPDFLVHRAGDNVGVAVRDLAPGEAEGRFLEGAETIRLRLAAEVPLGHKLCLDDITEAAEVLEYGARIGLATRPIGTGDHVHVHNLRSARW